MNPVEKVETQLALIAEVNPDINALTNVYVDEARDVARSADGPLRGVTFAVKDNIAVAGRPWTGGVAGYRGRIAEANASVVDRLLSAGAVLIGSANQHEGALGGTTDNPTFGRTLNPLDQSRTAGGSSGGSAAAVAAGFCDLALGSDTMGSVRLPAAYCGLFGLKPTFGLIPRDNFCYLAPSLDTIGPIARDVGFLMAAHSIMAGRSSLDADSADAPASDTGAGRTSGLSGRRFAVPRQLTQVDMDADVSADLDRVIDVLRSAGAVVEPADLSEWSPHSARRAGLLICEAEGAVEMADLMDEAGAMSDELRRLLRYGRDAGTARLVSAYHTIRRTGAECRRTLQSCDAILMPSAPQRAFPFALSPPQNQADLTALANFAGCPAISIPVPGDALPGSVQLVGPPWSEARLGAWAKELSEKPD